jgi:maleate isomerase
MGSDPIRLGAIVPSVNTTLEEDLLRPSDPRVRLHFTRILNEEDTEEQLSGMKAESERAAWLLSHTGAKAIVFGCTSGSFLKGMTYDREVVETMTRASGSTCVTTSGCVLDALRAIGARRVHLLTPYEEWLTRRAETFLAQAGFEVVGASFKSLPAAKQSLETPEEIARWGKREVKAGAEAIFISCTNFRGMQAADELERLSGIPVVTSNQATYWGLLRAVGLRPSVTGFGRLLRDAEPPTA